MNSHLNHEQLCDLLIDKLDSSTSDKNEQAREHVSTCAICSGELATLRQSLSLFRSSANAWAEQAWSTQPVMLHREALRQPTWRERLSALVQRPVVWSAVAAAAVLAIALPLAIHHGPEEQETPVAHTRSAPAAGSHSVTDDDALLLEVNQTLSSSVPSPMQPLADPTASTTDAQSN